MIVGKSSLRVSLVGGSTDTDAFLEKYKNGAVISFTPDIFTFVSLHENNLNKYIINYSKKEEEKDIDKIKNDIVRETFKHFNVGYCTVTFNSNILSSGSGLASSSSYTISLIKAISIFKKIHLTDIEICNLALYIEKKFNPLAGQQDIYGCGLGGFKRINFEFGKPPSFRYLDISNITNKYEMYLLNTNITRSSTELLKTIDPDKSYNLLKIVDEFEDAILTNNEKRFFELFNDGWNIKKTTSPEIINSSELMNIDSVLCSLSEVAAHKLCGAGGGGYFLIFVKKEEKQKFEKRISFVLKENKFINISIYTHSISGAKI